MPTVTLRYNKDGVQAPAKPPQLTPTDQTITFILEPDATKFAATPIVFPNPAPSGFHAWPGPPPTLSGNTVTARCNKPLGKGQSEKYKYNIVWFDGQLDPEIENTGSGGDPDTDKGRDDHHPVPK